VFLEPRENLHFAGLHSPPLLPARVMSFSHSISPSSPLLCVNWKERSPRKGICLQMPFACYITIAHLTLKTRTDHFNQRLNSHTPDPGLLARYRHSSHPNPLKRNRQHVAHQPPHHCPCPLNPHNRLVTPPSLSFLEPIIFQLHTSPQLHPRHSLFAYTQPLNPPPLLPIPLPQNPITNPRLICTGTSTSSPARNAT
jgi:hypothetical protein